MTEIDAVWCENAVIDWNLMCKWCACGVKTEEKIDKWKKMDKMNM